MSIYPVDFKNDKFWRKTMDSGMRKFIKKSKCIKCSKKMYKGKGLWAYHAITHGYAFGDWWCSAKCCWSESTINEWKKEGWTEKRGRK